MGPIAAAVIGEKRGGENPLYSWERIIRGHNAGEGQNHRDPGTQSLCKYEQDGREAVFLTLTPTISLPSTK